MKRKVVMLTVWAGVLALVLVAVALLYDRMVDKERLEQVSNLPKHTALLRPTVEDVQEDTQEDTTAPTRAMAPDFVVYDATGKAVSLGDFRGKPVVISFWVSWRTDCKEQMPVLQAAYDDYKDEVHFLIVNVPDGNRETREKADAFLKDRGYTFPVYYDTDANAQINYDVQNMPSTYFVDAQGRAMAFAGGKITRSIFEKGLARCYHE